MSHLEINEVVLAHCNIVNDDDQQDSIFLYTFVSNKSIGHNSPKYFIFLIHISIDSELSNSSMVY